jgi:hypothetical protein
MMRKPTAPRTIDRGGLRADVLVSAGLAAERVAAAPVSSALPRSIISMRLSDRLASRVGGAWKCASSPSVGRACGYTTTVTLAVGDCRAPVNAIVAPLTRGLDVVVGGDVLRRAGARIDFSTTPTTITCRAGRRRPR